MDEKYYNKGKNKHWAQIMKSSTYGDVSVEDVDTAIKK